jgi:glycosyltransferase involved in cell wall biosynthesis
LNRISVVIASLLKPVDDPRMYEKLGFSLAQTNKYEINIIGFSIKKNIFQTNMRFFPVFRFYRMNLIRLFQPLRYFRILFKVKPKVIIVNSSDLLIVTLIYSIITRTVFIYDIQENYYRNILYNSQLPLVPKYILGFIVRLVEYLCHPFINQYLIAEKGYLEEMTLVRRKNILLRNLYVDFFSKQNTQQKQKDRIIIIYSGTIAKVYGIFRVIEFIELFHRQYPEIELDIIGYCAHRPTLDKIKRLIADKPYINLTGGSEIVPHQLIIDHIRMADFGIINYELNPAIINCFPSKIYEYMGNRLPILIQQNLPWSDFCAAHQASVNVNFDSPDFETIMARMKSISFYDRGIPKEIYWKEDESKLIKLFDGIFPDKKENLNVTG